MNLKHKVKSTIKFYSWRLRNPGKPFSEFYINHVCEVLNNNIAHPTLGINHKDAIRFEKTSKIEKDFLIRQGLKPSHNFVDYGCGSLRLGKELIPYLDSGKYHGLDVTDQFFLLGKSLIDPVVWKTKQPSLNVINEKNLKFTSDKKIDFLMSCAVLYHIPAAELPKYFTNIVNLLKDEGKAFVDFTYSKKVYKRAMATWSYPKKLIENIAGDAGANVIFHQLNTEESVWYPKDHVILELTRN